MTATFSKEELITALRSTFIGDSKTLKETADYLSEACKKTGFSMSMMQIVDDASLPLDVKQAALIQLKNNVKLRWLAKKEQIEKSEKQAIKSALLLAVTRCHKNHKLIKLYKETFTIITSHQYKNWLPVLPIVERLGQDQDMVPLIHVLLAIAASFEFSITEQERSYFFEFLKAALPALLSLVSRRQDPQIIYLSIKFLWKAVHYEISTEIKSLVCGWMPLLHAIITATNQQYDSHPEDIQQRETQQFYYFHSKKWATRIFLRFVQKHAKRLTYNKNEDNKPFSDHWYANFGTGLITGLIGQFNISTTKKVRYFQLKCLQTLISERPEFVKQYAQPFQYDFLLRFLRLQPEDEELAQREPIQFLARQDQPSINFTNLKRVATDVWVGFADLGSKPQKKGSTYQPGVFFFQNMNYLQSKLQGTNPIEKQLAMYLICQLRSSVTRCKQVKKMLPSLISKYVIPEFQNEIMFLRARAVDIFREYGSMQLQLQVVKKAVEGIYICLTKDTSPLVRIKASAAFNCILKHKQAKDLVRPLLKDILTVYLQLLEHYDLEDIINSLESIVEDFATEIAPFAYQLIKHLAKLYYKLFNKDVEQTNQDQYDGQAELAAAGCLKTITRIVDSPIPQQTINQLEPEIISLLQFIFGQEGADYVQDALVLLNSYLFKIQRLTPHMWFYYQVVVYNLVGIPKEMWSVVEKLPLHEKQKQILKNIKGGNNHEYMEQTMPVIRNFIQKASVPGAFGNEANSETLKNSLLSLLFYLISQIYKEGPNKYSGEVDVTCCVALLIYLLQNFQKNLPQTIYTHIWQFAKMSMNKFKSKMMRIMNSQLLGLLLWNAPTQVLTLAHGQQMLANLLKEVCGYESKYELQHERARVILGLNTLLALPQKPQQILDKIPDIFRVNLKLVKKNAQERIEQDINNVNSQNGQAGFDDEFEDEQQDDDCNFQSDDQDFWEQMYDENYSSALDSIDQIKLFKDTIQKLAVEQPTFYAKLMELVTGEELLILEDKIKKALQQVEQLASN